MHDVDAVKKYRNRREARLGIATTHSYDSVMEYRRRRAERMGLSWEDVKKTQRFRKSKDGTKVEKNEIKKGVTHMDAPNDEEGSNNNNNSSGSGGGHGNTRLPFGLCQRFGIEIGKDWTPKDAWDALAGKGITADGAYERLKKGEDPGTPDTETETEFVDFDRMRIVSIAGDEYIVKEAEYKKEGGATGEPWVLMGSLPGHKDVVGELASFKTKKEMFQFLKEQGVEEFPDPETGELLNPQEMELPKDPVKTFKIESLGDAEYGDISGYYSEYYGRGMDKWKVKGRYVEGTASDEGKYIPRVKTYTFHTRTDMYEWLKNKGIEEFTDPQTGEVVNPQEMQIPDKLFSWAGVGYTAMSVGIKGDQYALFATDYDGKKRMLDVFSQLSYAISGADRYGVKEEDIQISPAAKKRESERKAWLTSDKKEWIDRSGVRYGDLRAKIDSSGYLELKMTDEYGDTRSMYFAGKTDMMRYLKEQGVEKIKFGKEDMNPLEYKEPDKIGRYGGIDYQELSFKKNPYGEIGLYGVDLDGRERLVLVPSRKEKIDDFMRRSREYLGVDESSVGVDDETKEAINQIREIEEAKEKWKAEFATKAVDFRGGRYADLAIISYPYSDTRFSLYGTDEEGERDRIYRASMKSIVKECEEAGIDPKDLISEPEVMEKYEKFKEFTSKATEWGGDWYTDIRVAKDSDGDYIVKGINEDGDELQITTYYHYMDELVNVVDRYSGGKVKIDDIIKDDDIRKEYEDYKKRKEEFEAKAITFFSDSDHRYVDVEIGTRDDEFLLNGYDSRGRKKIIYRGDLKGIEQVLSGTGKSVNDVGMSDNARQKYDFELKEQEAIASGEYKDYGGHAYKDFHLSKLSDNDWVISATKIDGDKKWVFTGNDLDEVMHELERREITDYDLIDVNTGQKIGDRPKDGMRKVRMLRTPDGEYKIMATTGKETSGQVHSASSEEEARQWLRDNGVDDTKIKTKGMNPNDDVPRTHTCHSLSSFDAHRSKREDDFSTLTSMSDAKKKEVVDMLTDVFDQCTFRMRKEGHFEDIYDSHFKNLLETGTSQGSSSESGRRRTGEKTFGHEYDIDPVEAEKYGYLALSDDREAYESSTADWYGDIMYTFKKDAVQDRVTYTAGDSLDSGRPLAGYAGPHPTYEGMSALSTRTVNRILKSYNDYKNGDISFQDFYNDFCQNCTLRYIECQYHGMLTMDDVQSIIFPKLKLHETFAHMPQEKRQKVVTDLKNKGIMLQSYDYGDYEDGYEYLKKEFGLNV